MLGRMGAQSAEWIAMARLVRRSGFGATGVEVDAALKVGAGPYIGSMLAADPTTDPGAVATPVPTFAPIPALVKGASKAQMQARNQQIGAQLEQVTAWWLRRMVTAAQP